MPSSPKLLGAFAGISFAILAPLYLAAETPQPLQTRDEVIKEIHQMAERHAEGNQSMDTSSVLSVFEPYTSLLTRREMAQTYESAFLEAKNRHTTGFWSVFKPSNGWIVAAILFIVALFKARLEKGAEIAAEKIFDFIRKRLTRLRYIRNANLRRYRTGLANHYSKLKVPFLPRPLMLKDIFIPLRVINTQRITTDIDAFTAIRDYPRLVITGNPGAGKTVLLSYIALTFAQGKHPNIAADVVPIFFSLHRIREATDEKALRSHLIDELARCGMPAPEQFLDGALQDGSLMVLFDGLDEVSRDRRPFLVEGIKDFLRRYHTCRAVITCRSAVYENDFLEAVDEHLTITDFQDYQIIAFLHPWEKEMPEGRSVDHLIKTLRERPRILSMARNPLQLTMICSLYADEHDQFIMPHSRTEFYQRSTHLFLGTWHRDQNHFSQPHKAAVLEHLALHLHEVGGTSAPDADKRSLPIEVVLAEVGGVMRRLSYDSEKDIQAILDEIVERSGLLLRIDGGTRYQFAHLTIQEYYAAQALGTKSETLLGYYKTDPQHWREALRLWCGLDHDCSDLVLKVFDIDAVMALECVADAQRIDDNVASKVTTYFRENIEEQIGSTQPTVREAYAAIASSPWARGSEMLEFLGVFLNRTENDTLRQATADTLAATNVDAAAKILFGARQRFASLAPALVAMGDLAVPQLKELVDEDNLAAIDDLFTIGTPNAAVALVSRLWDSSEVVRNRSAWALVGLMTRPQVEHALSDCQLPHQLASSPQDLWLWTPFIHSGNSLSSLPSIVGRIADCLISAKTVPEFVQGSQLEPRLASAVAFIARLKEVVAITQMSRSCSPSTKKRLERIVGVGKDLGSNIDSALRGGAGKQDIQEIWDVILQELPKDHSVACLLRGLPTHLLAELTLRVFPSDLTDWRSKWKTMHHPPPRRWWLWIAGTAVIIALSALLVPAFTFVLAALWIRSAGWSWEHIGLVAAAGVLVLGCAAWILPVLFYDTFFARYDVFGDLGFYGNRRSRVGKTLFFLFGPVASSISPLIGIAIAARDPHIDPSKVERIACLNTLFCAPALLAAALALFQVFDWKWMGWGTVYLAVMASLFGLEHGKVYFERRISNPLRGLRFERNRTDVRA